ncbi:family 16 glycoside hydrolase [Portibacter marinus]|uniref:family 16 glycoside hydrolase n=1 Tax=Portibacter marinus TaxID=2898660 RepID=UPI001F296C72|nr:family 16 glycoside hydrolase [Portibacter marinus]
MRNYCKFLILILTIVTLFSCGKDEVVVEQDSRAHSPWVFRSVLDDMPRAITFALGEDLWVAYSTENASLYKAWKGSVDFDGAVYTSAHGPQPKIIGDAYIVNNHENPWRVKNGDEIVEVDAAYKGHKMMGNQAIMMYEITTPSNQKVQVTERPEMVRDESGKVGFERTFTVEGLPSSLELGLRTNVSSILIPSNVQTNSNFEIIESEEVSIDQITALQQDGILWMNTTGPTQLTTTFATKPLIENTKYRKKAMSSSANEGLALISASDCRTCHNVRMKTVGPAYMTIARRYAATEDNINYLKGKIRSGGNGVWGEAVMTAHPNIPDSDLEKMVDYILGLVPESEKAGGSTTGVISADDYLEPVEVSENDLILGALVKVYRASPGIQILPDYRTLTSPIMGGIMPNFDNMNDGKFTDLRDNFIIVSEGFLHIEEDSEIIFRMWSDDGSKLYINDDLVIDLDGTHGVESKDAKVGLKQGHHKFRIEYFNGAGGKFLSFNWKPKDAGAFEVVPPAVIYHNRNKQSEIEGLSLPMASMNTIPGDKSVLTQVHPSFTLSQARPVSFMPKVGGMDFLPDGRLAVSTWDEEGGVYLLSNVTSGNPSQITVKKIASGLAEPLGLKVVDGEIYVMQKQELTKLVDTNGDEMIDEYITVSNDWDVSTNFHEFGFGLEYQDGHFYATLATAILPGGASMQPQIQDRGKVIKINKETGALEFIAEGLRTPNGIGIGVDDEIFVADNQGDWLPSSKIVHVTEGDFFGGRSVDFEGTANLEEKNPLVWLPQDEIGNSPSTPSYLNVGPYEGQMIHGEVTHGGIKRVFVEKINGEYQGAVFRFTQGLEAGVNRIVWGPDDALYVGGVGNPGNWQNVGTNWYGLQRLAYNDTSTFEMLAVRSRSNGLEIEFTEPLRPGEGWNTNAYEISQWYYKPTAEYGGPKLNESRLPVRSANVSEDRRKVFLEIPGIRQGYVVYVHLDEMFVSDMNHDLWSTEAWYTMNNISSQPGFRTNRPFSISDNTLTPAEEETGWELLFNGENTDGWKGYLKEQPGSSWVVENGLLTLKSEQQDDGSRKAIDGGDIMTEKTYKDFEFTVDWKISPCGNSGIIYFVHESEEFENTYRTGPEMQILDDACHPDTKYPTHRAGDLYDMIEGKYKTVKPAGEWNTSRIVSKDGKIEHWQNGRKIVEFTMFDDSWKQMVANSKFADWKGFGEYNVGHIALQDHDDPVYFKNIKIRKL